MKDQPVMIVTGASSGIGRALAERAARAGYDVVAVGRRAERLRELEGRVAGGIGRIESVALDLRTPDAAQRIVRKALEKFGRIDVLVNMAGGVAVGPASEQSDDAMREQFETHVFAPVALTREALAALRESHGAVYFVGSGVARIPVGSLGLYPPAKAAVRSLARIMRGELRPLGIAVTYVDPGAVATEFMTRAGMGGPPPGLAASPEDVARRVFESIGKRKRTVDGVPWQTFFVALAERFPKLTDAVLARAPQIVGGTVKQPAVAIEPPETIAALFDGPVTVYESASAEGGAAPHLPPPAEPESGAVAGPPAESPERSTFEAALEPHERRMQKLNLKANFVRSLLVPGTELDGGEVAMRWAGMPNKHERALTNEVLEALAGAGFIAQAGEDRFTVLRAPE